MTTTYLDKPQRAALENRVMDGIDRLDDSTLMALQAWLERPVRGGEMPDDAEKKGMTRRQALSGLLLGGAAVVGAGSPTTRSPCSRRPTAPTRGSSSGSLSYVIAPSIRSGSGSRWPRPAGWGRKPRCAGP